MLFSRRLAQLGLLGTFSLVGLSACAIWPGYRAPQGICTSSPRTVVTSSPPVSEAAPTTPPATSNTPPAAPAPPEEPSAASTLSVPAPVPPAPATGADAGRSRPSEMVPPPPAPPAVPSASSDAPAANSAESNRDQLRTQKPLDATVSSPAQADAVAVSGQPIASSPATANVMVTIPQTAAKTPADHPVGPLTKLRARFHNLIQPPPKSTAKASKATKSTNPPAAPQQPPQVVSSLRIPLPMSDPNRVVMEDTRAAHTIAPATEMQNPVATASGRDPQTPVAPVNAVSLPVDPTGQRANGSTANVQQIEQWPFGSQAAVKTAQVPNTTATDDFDPIPVDEYKAAVARASDATSLPTFNQTSPSESRPAATGSSNGLVPQPMSAAQAASELQVVPTTIAPQGNPAAQVDAKNNSVTLQPVSTTGPLPQAVPTAGAGAVGTVAPAIQISPAPPVEQTAPAPAPTMRPAQWIGGRYGQPAWMVPYLAGPEGSAQGSGQ